MFSFVFVDLGHGVVRFAFCCCWSWGGLLLWCCLSLFWFVLWVFVSVFGALCFGVLRSCVCCLCVVLWCFGDFGLEGLVVVVFAWCCVVWLGLRVVVVLCCVCELSRCVFSDCLSVVMGCDRFFAC